MKSIKANTVDYIIIGSFSNDDGDGDSNTTLCTISQTL